MRQVILDTETTGLEISEEHRVIEVGAVELVNRRKTGNNFHQYFNPGREIDPGAYEVHGIALEDLLDKPAFAEVADELRAYLQGAELIIHNASFDVGFLDREFELAGHGPELISGGEHCTVTDSLAMARNLHPGQKNNLDALCARYGVDNSERTLHGALLDAEILADVYLKMTGGQLDLLGDPADVTEPGAGDPATRIDPAEAARLTVTAASPEELAAHEQWLALLRENAPGKVVWDTLEPGPEPASDGP